MALNTTNSLAIAFNKLSGKAHTQQNFAVTEEGISTNVQMSFATVFANRIEPLPVTNSGYTNPYDGNGIVQRIKFEIDIIPDTQIAVGRSQGYRLKLPADWNGNGDLFPEFSAGTYLHSALGKLQIVPTLYGTLKPDGSTEYDPILYQTNGSTVIPKFDPINWYIDSYNGIIFIQDPPSGYDVSASRPGYLEAFLFVGDYIDDVIFNVTSGSTGTTGQNIGGGVGVFKDKIVTSGGTGVLRFKTLVGVGGIGISADTDNVLLSFSGATALTTTASNGLTKVGQNIRLGGELTGATTISGTSGVDLYFRISGNSLTEFRQHQDGFDVQVSRDGYNINNQISVDYAAITISTNNALSGFSHSITLNSENAENQGIYVAGIPSTFSGVQYDDDYSANFTLRSLVDKQYVDNNILSGSSNAANGLTKIGQTIVLGGKLTGTTSIAGDVLFDITITGDTGNTKSIFIGLDGVNFGTGFFTSPYTTSLSHQDKNSGYDTGISISSGNSFIQSSHPNFAGAQYDIDYSANYGLRSLVDKAYVTGLTSSLVASGITANNGLTKVGGNIRLGGTLTGNTLIALGATNANLTISGSSNNAIIFERFDGGLYFNDTTGAGIYFNDTNGGGTYFDDTNGGGFSINSNGGGISINDNGGGGLYFDDQGQGGIGLSSDGGGVFLYDGDTGGIYLDSEGTGAFSRVQLTAQETGFPGKTYVVVNSPTSGYTAGLDVNLGIVGAAHANKVVDNLTLTRSVEITGLGVAGIGSRIAFRSHNGNGSPAQYSEKVGITYMLTDVTPTSEDGKYIFSVNKTGGTANIIDIDSDGVKYYADYSANYTPRSLVDKAYVDAGISGATPTGDIVTATTFTASTSTSFVGVSGGSATTIWLPLSPTPFKQYTVCDIAGNAGTFNVTVNGNGNLIQGSSTALIDTDYGSITFVFNTYNWSVTAAI